MQARIIGPASELGDIGEGLNFYGAVLTREWSKIKVNGAVAAKLEGNRYVEVRGAVSDSAFDHDGDGKPGGSKPASDEEGDAIRARLTELGVEFKPNASRKTLDGLLEKAEAAKAAADEEAEAALAEANAQLGNDQPEG